MVAHHLDLRFLLIALSGVSVVFSYNDPPSYRPSLQNKNMCDHGSCYPGTGNLLIGRERNLTATSTCGLRSEERYCVVTDLSSEKSKCYRCDSRSANSYFPERSHRIENIVYGTFPGTNRTSWWQSENGEEFVSIRLDMEAEFHFTHLVIKFRSPRPAAMLVERSPDFGRTWKVYRYFAQNCSASFPGIPTRPAFFHDVYCLPNYYSSVTPFEGGEVILRVIDPNFKRTQAYSPVLQDLLKMTNLRINFTKLHVLDDTLLDDRKEIKEKYFYAVKEMTVRGSCWCYGHAEKCLPVEGVENKADMVHGRCECVHHTKGLNCELCEDLYNDLPWAPAVGNETNACKKCNCNQHAYRCEFDEEVYKASGNITGGVCQDCAHNTVGNNCERCKPLFYLRPDRDITDYDGCIPCDCENSGTVDGGMCDWKTDPESGMEAGQCHCKENVDGPRCDFCKREHWNFNEDNPLGCQECTCDPLGSIDNECDRDTGECRCKANVVGSNCNQCLPEHWGLSDSDLGCQPCDCDAGGAEHKYCDVISGQCKCRPHMSGRRCNETEEGYYIPEVVSVYEAELANCSNGNCQVVVRLPPEDGRASWTGSGFMRVYDNSILEFYIDDLQTPMDHELVVRYEAQNAHNWTDNYATIHRESPVGPNSFCANSREQDEVLPFALSPDSRHVVLPWPICLEPGEKYKIQLRFGAADNQIYAHPSASILIDSIALNPKIDNLPLFNETPAMNLYHCKELLYTPRGLINDPYDVCKSNQLSIAVYVHRGAFACDCNSIGSVSSFCESNGGRCQCKPNVHGRTCDRCAPGTYGFGVSGCKACDCHPTGSLESVCHPINGQCSCRNGTYGRSCDQCKPGSWGYPNCQPCDCNGHAQTCNTLTGECNDCRDSTTGFYCEKCQDGYYGNPRLGIGQQCKPCHCPDTVESGHSFASTCSAPYGSDEVVCQCQVGYTGARCDMCAENYYGEPATPGGNCQACECNNNIDLSRVGNCDSRTGECLNCLYNTTGSNCERCKPKFYGDALQQDCRECNCDILGTDKDGGDCNPVTGQCPCLPNVTGRDCSSCIENFWKIGLGVGCEPCDCDPVGSHPQPCNQFTGECICRSGFGGRQCNQCQRDFWGDPNAHCQPCQCNYIGSMMNECNKTTGACVCREAYGGEKCDQCARGWLGVFPNCTRCGECFDNWDVVITELAGSTDDIIMAAKEIKRTGATGAYNSEFDAFTKKIEEVENSLKNTKSNSVEMDLLGDKADDYKARLGNSSDKIIQLTSRVQNILNNMSIAEISMNRVNERIKILKARSEHLNLNATQLREKDLKGALTITREAGESSENVRKIEKSTAALLWNADNKCKRTGHFLNKEMDHFNENENQNENTRQDLEFQLSQLESKVPDLNSKVCDGRGNPCDDLCGGAGCHKCGGISCERGSVGKAKAGLKFAMDTEGIIKEGLKDAEKNFRLISQAANDTVQAHHTVEEAHNAALQVKVQFENLIKNSSDITQRLEEFINAAGATPSEIRKVATEALNLEIPFDSSEIKELARNISATQTSLENVQMILQETKDDKISANNYKNKSEKALSDAENILGKAQNVVGALDAARNAQKKAEDAIKKANLDIGVTKSDLTKIASETSEAKSKANNTRDQVHNYQLKIKRLQTGVIKNEHGASKVFEAAEKVEVDVKSAKSQVIDLTRRYNEITEKLKQRSENYGKSKQRAQQLLEKARKLSVNTKAKLKELKDADQMYMDQEKTLSELGNKMDRLSSILDNYIKELIERTTYHRNCVS